MLFGLVCVSICVNRSNCFINTAAHSSRRLRQTNIIISSRRRSNSSRSLIIEQSPISNERPSDVCKLFHSSSIDHKEGPIIRRSNEVHQKEKQHQGVRLPRLTSDEETDLLRLAVEYRRLNELEKEMAVTHRQTHQLLSVRAKAGGYDEDLERYEDAKYEGQLAREKLVTYNISLVHYCVNQIIGKDYDYGSATGNNNINSMTISISNSNNKRKKHLPLNSLSREDLIQEGAIGLARAVDKWNPDIGGKFSTYAVYWVRAAVLRCIAERDDILRVPNHVSLAVQKINKAAQRLGWVLQESGGITVMNNDASHSFTSPIIGSSQSWKAAHYAKRLAEEAGLSDRHFEEAMTVRRRRYTGGYVPFESWMQRTSTSGKRNGGGSSGNQRRQNSNHHHRQQQHKSDENEDHDRIRLESSVANEGLRTALSKHLKPKEMEALSWRYGLIQDEDIGNVKKVEVDYDEEEEEGESITDRANRQFLEMEQQLFETSSPKPMMTKDATASSLKAAVAVSVPSKTTTSNKTSTSTSTSTKFVANNKTTRSTITTTTTTSSLSSNPPPARGRFGEAMTFNEVGKKMQVSAEYTRLLCQKGIKKLQQAAEDGTLEPALMF